MTKKDLRLIIGFSLILFMQRRVHGASYYNRQVEIMLYKNALVDHRMISISYLFNRRKKKADVEFRSKGAVSVIDGDVFVAKRNWNYCSESIARQEWIKILKDIQVLS